MSFRDIVVQKAFFLVLSNIFEKQDYSGVCNEKTPINRYKGSPSFTAMFHQNFNSRFNIHRKKTIDLSKFPPGFMSKKSVHFVMRTIKRS